MNDRIKPTTRVLKPMTRALVLMMVLMLPTGFFASGDTETHFGDGNTENTVTFDGKGSDDSTTIKLPHDALVSNAALELKGEDNAGNYLYHPTMLIENERLWNFNGSGGRASGYGHLGGQEVFRDNSSSAYLPFSGGDYRKTSLYLPKNATVTSATLNISGKKTMSNMTPPEVLSSGTLVTKDASRPALAADGPNIYAVWVDNGDMNYSGNDNDIFFKRSSNNGQTWTHAICLSGTNGYSYYPSIAINGNNVYVIWYDDASILFRMSTDRGDNWDDIVEITNNVPIRLFTISVSGDHIYVAWDQFSGNYFKIFFAHSDDGKQWDIKKISGNSKNNEFDAYEPWVASRGSHVYVVWRQKDPDTERYTVAFNSSSDYGLTFQSSATHISSGNSDYIFEPEVACDENGHVYAAWRDYNSVVYDIYYTYSRFDGDSGTWSTPKVIDDTDNDINSISISSEKQSSVNNVYVAWEDKIDKGHSDVSFIRSTNENSFSTSQTISDHNGFAPFVAANNDGHVYVAHHIKNETSGLNNLDICLTTSADQGSSFSNGILLSWELFDGLSEASAVALEGDDIYLVWKEIGNISGVENGVDRDIFFRYFNGTTWSGVTVLSDDFGDGASFSPDIAVDGQNIYVVWQDDRDTDEKEWDVLFRYSSDGGQHWNPVKVLSDDPDDGDYSFAPKVAISGSTAYVVWGDNGDISGSGTDLDICFRKINAGTPDPSGTKVLSDESDMVSQSPDIAVDGQNINVVWSDMSDLYGSGTDADIFFRKSTNGGANWQDVVVVSQSSSSSYTPVISVGNYVYVAWRENSVYFSRSPDGNSWSEQKMISNILVGNQLSLVSNGDEVYLGSLQDCSSSGVYLTSSQDAGDNWDDPVDGSLTDSERKLGLTMCYGNDTLHLFWGDQGNISGSGYDYDIIYRQSTSSYPENVTLDVGDDGTIDWEWTGELNDTNSPQTFTDPGFVNALNSALSGAHYFTDSYGNDIAEVVLNLTSETPGKVYLDSLTIDYDYTASVQDFSSVLNNYLDNHQDDQDADGNITIPLTITTDSAGKIRLSDLHIEYELKKTLELLTPEKDDINTTTVHISWEAKNFESGDQLTIYNNTEGGAWTDITTMDVSDGSYAWDSTDMNGRDYRVKIEYTEDSNISDTSERFMIDNYPPATSHTFSYTNRYNASDDIAWGTNVSVTLIRNDTFPDGGEGSGVVHTNYSIDGGEWQEYSDSFYIGTHGEHTFDYYSEDKMGNRESTESGEVHIDTVRSLIGEWTIPGIDFETEGTVSVSVEISDADTGIDVNNSTLTYALGDETYPTAHQDWCDLDNVQFSENEFSGKITEDWFNRTLDWGTFFLYLMCTAADNVGNTASDQISELVEKDSTPPEITGVSSKVGTDSDNVYTVGSEVRLHVFAAETGLTGTVRIAGGNTDGSTFNSPLTPEGTDYYCDWNTTGLVTKSYGIKFTLTDVSGNSAADDSLEISLEKYPYPELSITGLLVDQNGESTNLSEGIPAAVTVYVHNSGTMDAPAAVVKLYDNQKDAGHLIGTETIGLSAGDTVDVDFTYTPVAGRSRDVRTLYAIVKPVAGETSTENNEDSIIVTVRKLPDLTVRSVVIEDEEGNVIEKAKEGDPLKIIAEVGNTGGIPATISVAAYSGTVKIASDTVTVGAGDTESVTLDWLSVPAGELNITVKVDANEEVTEGNENNNEMTIHLSVEGKDAGSTGDEESKSDLSMLIMGFVVIAAVFGAAGYFVMQKKKGREGDEWAGDEWDIETSEQDGENGE